MDNLGQIFKKAREDKGLSVKDVSVQTNIGSKFVKAIENNDFSVFPGEAYTVGFIRNYAEFLSIDPEEVIRAFYSHQISEAETPYEELVAPTKPKLNPIPITLLVLLIAAISVGVYFLARGKGSSSSSNDTAQVENQPSTQTQSTENTQNNPASEQSDVAELPIYGKKTLGDSIVFKIKDKKIKLVIKKIDATAVHIVLSSASDDDFLANMRRDFKIDVNKEMKFDIEKNKEYDFSFGVENISNAAQAVIYLKKIVNPYESERYYDYFVYQKPDQATLTELAQRASGTPSTTENQTTDATQNTSAASNLKLKLVLSNIMDRNSVIYVWIKKDTSPDIKTVKLSKGQSFSLDADTKIVLDTNNLHGLSVLINNKKVPTKTISYDGGVGKLRFWVDKSNPANTQIKWEIIR